MKRLNRAEATITITIDFKRPALARTITGTFFYSALRLTDCYTAIPVGRVAVPMCASGLKGY